MKQKTNHPTSDPDCRFCEDAARHYTGEIFLTGFEEHRKECHTCQEIGAVLHRLHSLPTVNPSAQLTANILAAIQQPDATILRPRFQRWAAAAAVVLSLTAWSVWQMEKKPAETIVSHTPPPTETTTADRSVQEALDWFCRTQEADGSWSPARWGGDPRFEVALTALPMLALLSSENGRNAERDNTILRAKEYLHAACDKRGRFGPHFYGSSYSQGIATLALLTSYQSQPDDKTKRLLGPALAVIMSQQQANGSWGLGATAQPDMTITLWQLKALKMAQDLGWNDVDPHVSLGSKWVAAHAPHPSDMPHGLSPTGDFDFFQSYIATTQLKEAIDETSRDQLSSIRHTLLRKQVIEGTDSGSWSPDDRWGVAGGRLYTTALASLSLH